MEIESQMVVTGWVVVVVVGWYVAVVVEGECGFPVSIWKMGKFRRWEAVTVA